MAIEFHQTDPTDPLERRVWKNLSGESLQSLAEKLIELVGQESPEEPRDEGREAH